MLNVGAPKWPPHPHGGAERPGAAVTLRGLASYQRPRVAVAAVIDGELAGLHERARPPEQGLALGGVQQLDERRRQSARRQAADVLEQRGRQRLLTEVPDDRAQL